MINAGQLHAVAVPGADHADPALGGMQQMLESMPQMACLWQPDGGLFLSNTAWRLYFGPQSADWPRALHPEDRLTLNLPQPGQSGWLGLDAECRLHRAATDSAEGEWHWFCLALRPCPAPGREDAVLVSAWSVDHYKTREAELEDNFGLQRKMLDVSVDCIKILSPDGYLCNINHAGCLALGVTPSSGRGREWLSLLPDEVRAPGTIALAGAMRGESARFPGMSLLPGQEPVYWDNLLTPVLGDDGKVSEIVCISRDITLERNQEQDLRLARQSLELAADLARLGSFEYCPTEKILKPDSRCVALMGMDAENRTGFGADFLNRIHPEDRPWVEALICATLTGTGPTEFECEFKSLPDDQGQSRYIHTKGVTLFETDRPWRIVGTVQDVSADRQIRQDLAEAGEKLATALEAEQVLAGEMLHRIKNLFTVVAGLMSISKREVSDNTEAVQVLDGIRQRIFSMARATEMVMQSAAGRRGEGEFDPLVVSTAVLQPYQGHVELTGSVAVMSPSMLTPLVLLLHEMATNSLKYGALRESGGRVALHWSESDSDFHLNWSETGGPRIEEAPESNGSGNAMLRNVVAMAGGELALDWQADGLRAKISLRKT